MSTFSERQRLEIEAKEAQERAEEAQRKHLRETRQNKIFDDIAANAVERSAKEQAEQEEAARLQAIEVHESNLREQMLRAYTLANGSPDGFEDAYPSLRSEHVKAQTLQLMSQKPITPADIIEAELRKLYKRTS